VRPERCRCRIIGASLGGALQICRPTALQPGARSIIPTAEVQFAAVDPGRPLEAGLGKIVRGRVERTLAWLNRCRRLAKDWENLNRNALAFLKLASIRLMMRRLCQSL
jgi:hypothetical protein